MPDFSAQEVESSIQFMDFMNFLLKSTYCNGGLYANEAYDFWRYGGYKSIPAVFVSRLREGTFSKDDIDRLAELKSKRDAILQLGTVRALFLNLKFGTLDKRYKDKPAERGSVFLDRIKQNIRDKKTGVELIPLSFLPRTESEARKCMHSFRFAPRHSDSRTNKDNSKTQLIPLNQPWIKQLIQYKKGDKSNGGIRIIFSKLNDIGSGENIDKTEIKTQHIFAASFIDDFESTYSDSVDGDKQQEMSIFSDFFRYTTEPQHQLNQKDDNQ